MGGKLAGLSESKCGDQQHKVQAGSWLSVESLKDQNRGQYYLVFILMMGESEFSSGLWTIPDWREESIFWQGELRFRGN